MFKRHKYNAKATWVDGIRFDSRAEAEFYQLFKADIKELQCKVYLTKARILMKPDFLMSNGNYAEVKGVETAVYKIKKRLWKVYGPANLEIWKLKGRQLVCDEIVQVG